jgi:hypothetical protein
MNVERSGNNIIKAKFEFKNNKDEQWLHITGDRHHDNPDCRQDLEKRDLELCKERGAKIIDIGDLFCAMQGKYDKRSNKSKVRPENQVDNYLDSLVSSAYDFYKPYSKNFLVMSHGNHETGILKHHETDLTERLVDNLNSNPEADIHMMGYSGFIWLQFKCSNPRFSKVLWYTHGYGGGGPVTQDFIQKNRQQVYIDADIMCSAHVHRSWNANDIRIGVSRSGNIERRPIKYIKVSTYKDEYKEGEGGFSVERGMGPRPLGGTWLRFYINNSKLKFDLIDQAE